MGKATKLVSGVALMATGVVLAFFGQWQLALTAASAGVGLLTQSSINIPPDLVDRTGVVLQGSAGSWNSIPVVYGNARIGGVAVDVRPGRPVTVPLLP
jgi:hypothetical protein